MKRGLLGLAAVLLGIGVIVASGSDDPAGEPQATATQRPTAGPVREAVGQVRYVTPKDRSEQPPKPARAGSPTGEPTPEQLAAAPFVRFSSQAAPRWQGVGLELDRLGHTELADETRAMATTLRAGRHDRDRDDQAIVDAQQALLDAVLAVDLDPPAAQAVAAIKDSIAVYDSDQRALTPD